MLQVVWARENFDAAGHRFEVVANLASIYILLWEVIFEHFLAGAEQEVGRLDKCDEQR